jgi:NADPH-dependent 2,4-dienoyl-CoA reductase/sulfur reductase-like enzyme/rhodanese-related sulfurtransferase
MKTIIIGGVAAGMSAATRLRRLDENAAITVYEMGEHVSYANCGLPYFVSGVIDQRDDLLLQTPKSLNSRFRLEVKVRHRVLAIDAKSKTVTVQNLDTQEIFEDAYDNLVLATGATPRMPDVAGIERALSLRDVTDVDSLKEALAKAPVQTVAIIGGGFVGIELAENIRKLGFGVTVVQRDRQILGGFDLEMIEPMQQRLIDEGIELALSASLIEITSDEIVLASGERISAGVVIAAAGVAPDNRLAVAAGLKIGETGGLWVDSQQRTSDPSIFAAGDAVEKHGELTGDQTLIPLANLANRHGRLIADAIAGLEVSSHNSIGTIIIGAFGLAAGMTGLSERAAIRAGIPFKTIHLHPSSHAGYYPGAKRLSLKVLFHAETGAILGAQAIGEDGVDKRIDVLATAIFAGLKIDDLMDLELAYAPQFGSAKDAINQAGYVGNNVLSERTPTIQWHELDQILQSGAVLVDVRTERENSDGRIEGSLNIPVDQLRESLDSLAGKRVVVHCQVGQRGHTATQILRGHGIEASNLDGGYITWAFGHGAIRRTKGK